MTRQYDRKVIRMREEDAEGLDTYSPSNEGPRLGPLSSRDSDEINCHVLRPKYRRSGIDWFYYE